MGVAVLVVVVVWVVKFLLELFVAECWGQVVVLESGVEAAADLLDGQRWSVAGALVLADAAVEQEAQGGHEIMSAGCRVASSGGLPLRWGERFKLLDQSNGSPVRSARTWGSRRAAHGNRPTRLPKECGRDCTQGLGPPPLGFPGVEHREITRLARRERPLLATLCPGKDSRK